MKLENSNPLSQMLVPEKWKSIIEVLDFSFQPIVNIYSGICVGVEALLRNYETAGFISIEDLFEAAYLDQALYQLEIKLRTKAMGKFKKINHSEKYKLFLNIDNRVLEMPDYSTEITNQILLEMDMKPSMVCFEISEKHQCRSAANDILSVYKKQNFKIALDDFGAGFAGLRLLYHSEPDYIKIDRFFIEDINHDAKKKLFISNIVGMAHIMGMLVIAEGVETAKEFFVCKQIGCDLVQGFLVQKPAVDTEELEYQYGIVRLLNKSDKRSQGNDLNLITGQLTNIPSIYYKTDMFQVFETFRRHKEFSFFPIVDENREPMGIIHENTIKDYVFSPYGKELFKNKTSGKSIHDFTKKCPVAEAYTKAEKILEIFSLNLNSEGIIITDNAKYIGFLNAKSLLHVLNEKKLEIARDQNPLTRLPGNNLINENLAELLQLPEKRPVFIYFDFNHFKPFNDKYGFRLGDRAILLFSDMLKKHAHHEECFIGHIGGDDFFMSYSQSGGKKFERIVQKIEKLLMDFQFNILSFYNQEDRKRNHINALDRDGIEKCYPLLSVSAAVLRIMDTSGRISPEDFSGYIAEVKTAAKSNPNSIAVFEVVTSGSPCVPLKRMELMKVL